MRPNHAFTLMEIMVVVMLLAIIAAAAAPMLGDTDTARLRGAAQLLAADLDLARIEGITRSDDPVLLVARPTNLDGDGGYHLARRSTPTIPILDPTTQLDHNTTFGRGRAGHLPGVSIESISLDGDDRLGFGMYGQLDQSSPATLTLRAGSHRLTVTVHPTTGATMVD